MELNTGSDYGSSMWSPEGMFGSVTGFAGYGNEGAAAAAAWDAAVSGAFYQNAANSMGTSVVSTSGTTYSPTNTGIAELPIEVPSWMTQLTPEAQQDVDSLLYGETEDVTSWIVSGSPVDLASVVLGVAWGGGPAGPGPWQDLLSKYITEFWEATNEWESNIAENRIWNLIEGYGENSLNELQTIDLPSFGVILDPRVVCSDPVGSGLTVCASFSPTQFTNY